MDEALTRVALAFVPEHLNFYLRFGRTDRRVALDRRRAFAFFRPGRTFAYVLWRADAYGTQDWRILIARSAGPGAPLTRHPGVRPGADMLLFARGKTRVKRTLSELDALEIASFDPACVSPAFYRHLHNRIMTGRPIRPYCEAQHAAFQAALRIST